MNTKLLKRFICAFLSVLMLVCMMPALAISATTEAFDFTGKTKDEAVEHYTTKYSPESMEAYLETMELKYDGEDYQLYFDPILGTVAYHKVKTDEWLMTNPWDVTATETTQSIRPEVMSQVAVTYVEGSKSETLYSFTDAAMRQQIKVSDIKNGIRVEYVIGERVARKLVPMQIEATAFEEKILAPLQAITEAEPDNAQAANAFRKIKAFYNKIDYLGMVESGKLDQAESYALKFPATKKKNINIYNNTAVSDKQMREIENYIRTFCTNYNFEELDIDHDYVEYIEESDSPLVFRLALEYRIEDGNLTVTMPANGIRYDESTYRITDIQILPYMGACYRDNEGYSFIPDGAGTLYELDADSPMAASVRVYGDDYALAQTISTTTDEIFRMPVFGQMETIQTETVTEVNGELVTQTVDAYDRGYLAIIEEGASLASIRANHVNSRGYSSVIPSFTLRPNDMSSAGGWKIYSNRRYADHYKIRYIMLTDDKKAEDAQLSSYYECSWMGMACAYRDYISANNESFKRLTQEDLVTDAQGNVSIPLYIETFGSIETVKKVMSMPVTVSVALTSFEDIAGMYDYLASAGITNVNFKMTGYANGGMYSDVPYKLKWEKAVGGKSGFEELAAYAAEKGFGLYPDFDFVYTTQEDGGSKVNSKDNLSRTIDNRYTTRRVYSATQQTKVSYYQMVLSPATYSKFYEKLCDKYLKYQNSATGISLSTFGDSLNSDYKEDETVLREEAMDYVVEALSYFKNNQYSVMLNGGNAYTWNYADHILNVALDSSRYSSELTAVPFMGFVLHGYVEFAGTPLNTEGNLNYAILKAIENGASVYFVLSAANTELLKEDVLLSQNYSVRYDIWQTRLVEIYHELNQALADVQTLLITNHEILDGEENASQRVPEMEELLADIAEEAERRKQEIADKLEADRQAEINALNANFNTVKNAATGISKATTESQLKSFNTLRYGAEGKSNDLLTIWETAKYFGELTPDDTKASLINEFSKKVMKTYYTIVVQKENAEATIVSAKKAYDAIVLAKEGSEHLLVTKARENLNAAIDNYLELLKAYAAKDLSFVANGKDAFIDGNDSSIGALQAQLTDGVVVGASALINDKAVEADDLYAFIFGNTVEAKYENLGTENLYNAFVDLLIADGLYVENNSEASVVDVAALAPSIREQVRQEAAAEDQQEEENNNPTGGDTTGGDTTGGDTTGGGTTGGDTTGGDTTGGDTTGGDTTGGDTTGDGSGEENGTATIIVPEPAKGKYTLDNDIVVVTYGEVDKDVKSFILNFNDYAVQTTYRGVTYTIGAYDYVVINWPAQ